jgi:hypothetical protein
MDPKRKKKLKLWREAKSKGSLSLSLPPSPFLPPSPSPSLSLSLSVCLSLSLPLSLSPLFPSSLLTGDKKGCISLSRSISLSLHFLPRCSLFFLTCLLFAARENQVRRNMKRLKKINPLTQYNIKKTKFKNGQYNRIISKLNLKLCDIHMHK